MSFLFILHGHEPVAVDDVRAWSDWYTAHHDENIVGRDKMGEYTVSTIFLGCAHSPFTITGPSLFETAILKSDGAVDIVGRYRTWDEAAAGHVLVVAELTRTVLP